jgi:hypothetical protein
MIIEIHIAKQTSGRGKSNPNWATQFTSIFLFIHLLIPEFSLITTYID